MIGNEFLFLLIYHLVLFSSTEPTEPSNCFKENTYIVFESSILSLFASCTKCNEQSTATKLMKTGSLLSVSVDCDNCGYTWIWRSQPYINNIPAGNLLISGSILFSGTIPSKILRVFELMNCATISSGTFFAHQKKYLFPSIDNVYKWHQFSMMTILQNEEKELVLGGDGRCDSPGFSAKYGAYSFMELDVVATMGGTAGCCKYASAH